MVLPQMKSGEKEVTTISQSGGGHGQFFAPIRLLSTQPVTDPEVQAHGRHGAAPGHKTLRSVRLVQNLGTPTHYSTPTHYEYNERHSRW